MLISYKQSYLYSINSLYTVNKWISNFFPQNNAIILYQFKM